MQQATEGAATIRAAHLIKKGQAIALEPVRGTTLALQMVSNRGHGFQLLLLAPQTHLMLLPKVHRVVLGFGHDSELWFGAESL